MYDANFTSGLHVTRHVSPTDSVPEGFEPYFNLMAAILERAKKDLLVALENGNKAKAKALKKWFLSSWGQQLSLCNGQLIIDRIEKEFTEQKERKKK